MFTWENSHRREFHAEMTFWFRIAFTWWLGLFILRYLKVHFTLIKYTCDSYVWFNNANITHALSVPVYRQTDFTPKRVNVSRLHDTAARFRTRVKFSTRYKNRGELTPGDSRRNDILWWYHVNKYRALRGNRSELAPGRKSPRCHVNTPRE